MYIFSGVLEALEGNKSYPAGEKHAALLYVLADDHDLAAARIPEALQPLGWLCAELQQSGEMDESHLKPELDPMLIDSFHSAQKNGFALIIYTDPIK
jgi:hypothetical protein